MNIQNNIKKEIKRDMKRAKIIGNVLHEGQRVSNYRDLCKLLKEPIKSGGAKMYQVKDWNRFFEFDRDKNAIIITKVYKTPRLTDKQRLYQKEEKKTNTSSVGMIKPKKSKTGKYIKYIEPMILDMLNRYGTIHETKNNLYCDLGMVNLRYMDYLAYKREKDNREPDIPMNEPSQNDYEFFKNPELSKKDISDFNYYCILRLNSILTHCLDSMKKRNLIAYTLTYCIVENINGEIKTRYALKDEIKKIKRIQKDILHLMSVDSLNDIYKMDMTKEYFESFQLNCSSEYGWIKCFPVVAITKTVTYDFAARCNLGDSENLTNEERRVELNKLIYELLKGIYQKKYDDCLNEIELGIAKSILPDDFVSNGHYLCEQLIKM